MRAGILSALLIPSLVVSATQLSAAACTSVVLNKTPGIVVTARTMDFDSDLGSKICFRPKNTAVTDPNVKFTKGSFQALSWTSKYDSVVVDGFDLPAYADGMNSEGLAVATLWQYETEAAKEVKANTKGMSNVTLVQYVLDNAKDVDEAKKLISQLSLFMSTYNGAEMLLHWTITDKSGKTVAVELKDGTPKFFDSCTTIGVMTNSPTYDKQLANLEQQATVRATDIATPLPGDFRSTSRFVKAAYLVSTTPTLKTADEGMRAAMQILHNVEVPKGAQDTGSYTQWMVVRDQTNLRYWFASPCELIPTFIDLKKIDFQKASGKRIPVEKPANFAQQEANLANQSSQI